MSLNWRVLTVMLVCVLIWLAIALAFIGCDTAQADPYKARYEKQLAITDSIVTINDTLRLHLNQQVVLINSLNAEALYWFGIADSLRNTQVDLNWWLNKINADIDSAIVRHNGILTDYLNHLRTLR